MQWRARSGPRRAEACASVSVEVWDVGVMTVMTVICCICCFYSYILSVMSSLYIKKHELTRRVTEHTEVCVNVEVWDHDRRLLCLQLHLVRNEIKKA